MSKKGFTLIELVLGLSMLIIMLPSTMAVFQQVLQTKVIAECRITSASLAQMVLEHETQKRFSALSAIPETAFDAGNAATNPYFDPEFAAYTYEVQTDCMWHAASNGLESNLNAWTVDAACSGLSADYKRLTVIVRHPFSGELRLVTMMTNSTDPGECAGRTVNDASECGALENSCNGGGVITCVPAACACPNLNDNGVG